MAFVPRFLVEALAARGWRVHLLSCAVSHMDRPDPPVGLPPEVSYEDCPLHRPLARLARRLPGRLGREVEAWIPWIEYVLRGLRFGLAERPDRVVAFDMYGLLPGRAAALGRPEHLFYWSLEILTRENVRVSLLRRFQRWTERRLLPGIGGAVVQDPERTRAIEEILAVPLPSVRHVPANAYGPSLDPPHGELHRRMDLPSEARVLLHAGYVHEEGGLLGDVLARAAALPDPWRLAVHFPTLDTPLPEWLARFCAERRDRVALSTERWSVEDLPRLYASAEAVLAGYPSGRGPNYDLTPHASGKIGWALRCGVPIVAWGPAPLRAFVERTRCGVFIETPDDLSRAVAEISDRRPAFVEACRRTYEEELEMGRAAAPMLEAWFPRAT